MPLRFMVQARLYESDDHPPLSPLFLDEDCFMCEVFSIRADD